MVNIKWLGNKVCRTLLHGLNRAGDCSICRHDNHRKILPFLAHPLEHLDTVEFRQLNVEEYETWRILLDGYKGLFPIVSDLNIQPHGLQAISQDAGNVRFIINNENWCTHRFLSTLHPLRRMPCMGV